MMRDDFFKYQGQTSPYPLAIEISHAKGSYIYDSQGKEYLDFVAGVSANTLGHNPSFINDRIKEQLDLYSHVMVYGEFIQKPQVELAKSLAKTLTGEYSVYLTNSGTEATEGALKLAKRVTQRPYIISAKNAYHGNTQGAMSVCGVEKQNSAFRPLIPGTHFIEFNNDIDIAKINHQTAAVILETIQGGAGFIEPTDNYLSKIKARCEEVGALLILDEIQTGIGRTGTFWGFENYNVIPDIVITGKGLGGGMPIGAFIAHKKHMDLLKENPTLGHITTFGGHPVIASAGHATITHLSSTSLIKETLIKEQIIKNELQHPAIKEIRGRGLMLALILENEDLAVKLVHKCLEEGLILFFLLFEPKAIRITPPLSISIDEIKKGCKTLLDCLRSIY